MMQCVGGPLMAEYQKAKQLELIEPGILPLCDALHQAGAHPLSSCEGHPNTSTWLSKIFKAWLYREPVKPFVLFSSPVAYAKAYNLELKKLRRLNYHWWLHAYFHPKSDELVWVIEPCDEQLNRGVVEVVKLNSDIAWLSAIAKNAANNHGDIN